MEKLTMKNRTGKAYLMTHKATGSTMAFDELGEVDDPVALICKLAAENLEDEDIHRLQMELGKISEFGQDDLLEGVRPAKREAGHGYLGQDSARGDSFEQMFGPMPKLENNFRREARGPPMGSMTATSTAMFGGSR